MAITQIQGGLFQDAGGNPLAFGTITFQLSQQALVAGGGAQVIPGITQKTALNAQGSVANGTPLWFNSSLNPSGTFYTVNLYNGNGVLVRGPETWVLQGGSPLDLGTITPASSAPAIVLTTPSIVYNVAGAYKILSGLATYVSGGTLTVNFSSVFSTLISVVGTGVGGASSIASASASSVTFTTTNNVYWIAIGT